MAHDTCLQSAFSAYVGISGYCISRGVQTWQGNKAPFSTSLEKTLALLSKPSGLTQRRIPLQWRQRLVSNLKRSKALLFHNKLLRTVGREVKPIQILTMQNN